MVRLRPRTTALRPKAILRPSSMARMCRSLPPISAQADRQQAPRTVRLPSAVELPAASLRLWNAAPRPVRRLSAGTLEKTSLCSAVLTRK